MPTPNASNFDSADPARLVRALAIASEQGDPWTDAEIAAIYQHEMNAPAHIELGAMDSAIAQRVRLLSQSSGLLLQSIGAVLHHPEAPIELLMLLKEFAKTMLEHPDSALPRHVAGAIYWCSIAAALVSRKQRISSKDDAQIIAGFDWAIARPWLDPASRELLRRARESAATRVENVGGDR